MSLDTALARGRAAALKRMRSRVTVRRKTGDTTPNPITGEDEPVWEVVATDIPYRLVPKGDRTVSVAGMAYPEATARGDVPFDTDDVQDSDHHEITSGEWAGEVVRVIKAVRGDQRTARQLPVVSVPRPSEWG